MATGGYDHTFDGGDTCELCGKSVQECQCPECEVCGAQGCTEHKKLIKVRVRVPATFEVDYIIEVDDPEKVDAIQEQMQDMDASRWENDPQFYERLGDDWGTFVIMNSESKREQQPKQKLRGSTDSKKLEIQDRHTMLTRINYEKNYHETPGSLLR
jgi:hypothetical protein